MVNRSQTAAVFVHRVVMVWWCHKIPANDNNFSTKISTATKYTNTQCYWVTLWMVSLVKLVLEWFSMQSSISLHYWQWQNWPVGPLPWTVGCRTAVAGGPTGRPVLCVNGHCGFWHAASNLQFGCMNKHASPKRHNGKVLHKNTKHHHWPMESSVKIPEIQRIKIRMKNKKHLKV